MTPLPRRRTAAAIALAALALPTLAACASPATAAKPAAGAQAPAAPATSTAPGTVTTIDGKTVAVPGDKPVALVFMSIGCVDCAAVAKAAAAAHQATGAKAAYLGVDLDTGVSAADINGFLSQIGVTGLPVTIDPALATTYQVAALSTVLVLDKAGHVTYRAVTPSAGDIESALAKAGA